MCVCGVCVVFCDMCVCVHVSSCAGVGVCVFVMCMCVMCVFVMCVSVRVGSCVDVCVFVICVSTCMWAHVWMCV